MLAVALSIATGERVDAQPSPILLDGSGGGRPTHERGCLSYEPVVVVLEGTLEEREGYPPDNEPEMYWALELPQPIFVSASRVDPEMNIEETGVSRVHLTLPWRTRKRDQPYVAQLVGRVVRAEGTLFHQHTAHHHETLVLVATRVTSKKVRRR